MEAAHQVEMILPPCDEKQLERHLEKETMGREAKPLITVALPVLDGRVEVLVAEACLAHSAVAGRTHVVEEQLLSILVMFDPQPADRWSARAMAGGFISAKCELSPAPSTIDLVDWLDALMMSRSPSSACTIVIVLPDTFSSEVAGQIDAFLQRTKNAARHCVGLVAGVASNTAAWSSCMGIDGFVFADPGKAGQIGLQTFSIFSALMAPGMVTCTGTDDLESALGTAQTPSQVCQGVWMATDGTLALPKSDSETLATSEAVVCVTGQMPLASLRQLLRAVHVVASRAEVSMVIHYGLTATAPASDRMRRILLLCR